jgi:branched-chain amino acid transport system permease protein
MNIEPRFRGLLVLGVLVLLLPLALPNAFYYDIAIRIAINATIAIGLNMLIGYTGQISLGHAGFFGLGAYGSGILTARFGWPSTAALPVTAIATGLLAYLVARPILRLKKHFLAIATLGFGIIINIVIVNEAAYTGGPDGMAVGSLSLFGFEITGERLWYGVFVALLVFVAWMTVNLVNAPMGRALQAIHGSEIAARVAGIDVVELKIRIFVFSAVLTSIMGGLSAHYSGFISPASSDSMHSIELVTMVVVGGMASIYGSIVGAAILTMLPQVLARFEGWETTVFGLILMLSLMFMPRGVVPTLRLKLVRSHA